MYRMSSDQAADGRRLMSVLIAGGHSEPEVRRTILAATLHQMTLGTYSSIEISGIEEVVLSERVAMAEALGDRSHEIRTVAVVLLTQTPGALVPHLDRVLELTRDTSKQVREAALNALNIGSTPIAGGLIDRRLALMQKRAEEGRGFDEPETVRKLIQLEDSGFEYIANVFDLALELKAHHEFVKAIHKMANNSFTVANVRRSLNLELDRLAVSLVS